MKYTLSIIGLLALLLLVGCANTSETPLVKKGTTTFSGEELETSQELKKFESEQELKEYLESNQQSSYRGFPSFRSFDFAVEESAMADGMVAQAAVAKTSGGSATDFSQTNVQVKGVDEADFVKNDGKYIYTLTQDKLIIVDAFPAEQASIVSETEIAGRPQNLFINGNQMVIFSEEEDQTTAFSPYDIFPRPRYTTNTLVLVYDITDKTNPELTKEFSLTGNYFQSRMIGDIVYFISKDSVRYYDTIIDVPVVREFDNIIAKPDIYYFDNPEQNYVFHTVASLDLGNVEELNAQTFMMGYSNALYVSTEALYITYQKNLPYIYYEEQQKQQFFDVVLPLLPEETQSSINALVDSDLSDSEQWDKISVQLEVIYNTMTEKEKQLLWEKVNDALNQYHIKQQQERMKTVIHKISLDEGQFDYETRAEVPGTILNQFSMDEHKGNFRIATTLNIWAGEDSIVHNNVYVLNKDLKQVGELEGIAPDESIFSTRFIGDRLYMVTFERIDPFFVIDLSTTQPKILGELKIPGFSDYLHPYDENHIIGIGKETKENQWGGVSTQGVKLALFDVTDVTNPKQVDKIEIGEAGSDSEALHDHKAFLFDKEKNILVLPVREIKGKDYYDSRYGYYRQRVWQGAYVLGLTPEDGFEVKATISHSEGDEQRRYYYYSSPSAVKRSLYMDDALYTISQTTIKAHSLEDLDQELVEVDLPYKDQRYYPEPYPIPRPLAVESIAVDSVVLE